MDVVQTQCLCGPFGPVDRIRVGIGSSHSAGCSIAPLELAVIVVVVLPVVSMRGTHGQQGARMGELPPVPGSGRLA
jgi:hypothetical protein